MIPAFQKVEGGLFSTVAKADVGDAVTQMKDVTLMAWADPFFPDPSTPSHVIEATVAALEKGDGSHYTAPIGNRDLKVAIANKLKSFNGLEVNPQRNILITPGSDSGLFFAMLPFINAGDEVMIIDPSYPNNFQNTEIMGGKIVRVPVFAHNNFQFEIEDFEKRVTNKTKMVVLTNPNNPTTVSYRKDRLEKLAKFIVKHDLILVVDQAFEYPVFDDVEMVTMAALPGMWQRTLTVCSLSKGMGLSGFRVGYIVADDKIMDKLYGATVAVLGATNTAAQIGAIAALNDDRFLLEYGDIFKERRDFVYEALKDIKGIQINLSESGFLSWVNISALGTEEEVVAYLIDKAKVSVNVGTPYGENGKGYIRIVHGVLGNKEDFQKAILRIQQALIQLGLEKGIQ